MSYVPSQYGLAWLRKRDAPAVQRDRNRPKRHILVMMARSYDRNAPARLVREGDCLLPVADPRFRVYPTDTGPDRRLP
jgi:hypothetical protein